MKLYNWSDGTEQLLWLGLILDSLNVVKGMRSHATDFTV